MANRILHEAGDDCKGRRSQKDEKFAFHIVIILLKKKKMLYIGNFFSKKHDIFNVDRG